MTRREMQAKISSAEANVNASHDRFRLQLASWKEHVNLPLLLGGSFAAGALVAFLPTRHIARAGTTLTSIAWQIARTFLMPWMLNMARPDAAPADAAPADPPPTDT